MFSIIHRVFLEYLNNCSAEERSDMIELLSEQLVHMVHTRDGAQVAMECIWHSTAKVSFFCPFLFCFYSITRTKNDKNLKLTSILK